MSEKEIRRLDHAAFAALSAELIRESGGLRFRAHGRSMVPFIRDGDVLVLERVEAGRVGVGDVVLFQTAAGALYAHRVFRRELRQGAWQWIARGDALAAADPPFTADQIIGRVTSIERDGKCLRLDRGRLRMMGWLWARTFPVRHLLRRVRGRLRRLLRK